MTRWLAVLALVGVIGCGADDAVVSAPPAATAGTWERVAGTPLPERARAVLVWTGAEVLVLGGDRFSCPPTASCSAPLEPPFADGAALDLDAGTWRPLADAPVGFHSAASAVVVGDDVYVLAYTNYTAGVALLRYRISADEWAQVPAPDDDLVWHRLVVAGDRLVAYVGSEETGVTGDAVLDPVTGEWTPLPEDPMTPAFDRTMVWSAPHLYLLDKENVPNPGSERPSVLRAARHDLAAGTWERLPDSEIIGGGSSWLAAEGGLVSPLLGGADGGEVNGWGRAYPNGGIFDIAAGAWRPLPDAPDGATSAGAVGVSAAVFFDTHGHVLDVDAGTWFELEQIPGLAEHAAPVVVAAGRAAVALADDVVWAFRTPRP